MMLLKRTSISIMVKGHRLFVAVILMRISGFWKIGNLALMVKLSFPYANGQGILTLLTHLGIDLQTCACPQVRSFVPGEAAEAPQ
jgi:hypothetical protein